MVSFDESDMMIELYAATGNFLNRTKYLYWINVTTFLLYFIDKLFSVLGCRQIRIPEWWLLFISGIGGAPSAMLAAWIFNHKSTPVRWCLANILKTNLKNNFISQSNVVLG